jgi:hypothetical protein
VSDERPTPGAVDEPTPEPRQPSSGKWWRKACRRATYAIITREGLDVSTRDGAAYAWDLIVTDLMRNPPRHVDPERAARIRDEAVTTMIMKMGGEALAADMADG